MTTRTTPRATRIAIYPYGTSASADLLKNTINETLGRDAARKLLTNGGSHFLGRAGDLVINWGSSTPSQDLAVLTGAGTLLNKPDSIRNASMKTTAMTVMQAAGVTTVESTTDFLQAVDWANNGAGVFARTRLQGHSGEGIVYMTNTDTVEDLGPVVHCNVNGTPNSGASSAGLYTKAITGSRREFRIHVIRGAVVLVQLKRRRNNYREDGNYSNIVRNHSNGWIYAVSNVNPNDKALADAVLAVGALGLDFGAVDVITNQEDSWVLEVNTAPGQDGDTTRTRYTNAFIQIFNNQVVSNSLPSGGSLPTTAATVAQPVAQPAVAVAVAQPVVPEVAVMPAIPEVPVSRQLQESVMTSLSCFRGVEVTMGGRARAINILTNLIIEHGELQVTGGRVNLVSGEPLTDFYKKLNCSIDPTLLVTEYPTYNHIAGLTNPEVAQAELLASVDHAVLHNGRLSVRSRNVNSLLSWSGAVQTRQFWQDLNNNRTPRSGFATQVGRDFQAVADAAAAVTAAAVLAEAETAAATRRGLADAAVAAIDHALHNHSHYALSIAGEITVGFYNQHLATFTVIGLDVPVAFSDVTVLRRIDL